MKIINTRLHGILDYVAAFFLLLPWMINFDTGGPDTRIMAVLGGLTIAISLCTDYEFGLLKIIPIKFHFIFDVLSAFLLLSLPWFISEMSVAYYWPVVLGAAEILIVVLSSSDPYSVKPRDIDITKP